MKKNRYSKNNLLENILWGIETQKQMKWTELEIKFAQLKSESSHFYKKWVNESAGGVVVVTEKPYGNRYKIHSDITQQEYKLIQENCVRLAKDKKVEERVRLDLRFGEDKIYRDLQQKKWIKVYKTQSISKQINLLVDRKQFRLNVSKSEKAFEKQDSQFAQNQTICKVEASLHLLRFIDFCQYHVSPYYFVHLARIYQTEDKADLDEFIKVVRKNDSEQIESFILNRIPKNNKSPAKYECEIRMTEEGIKKFISLAGKLDQLGQFVDELLFFCRKLPQPISQREKTLEECFADLEL